MSRKLYILGQSNYALAIIFDVLKLLGFGKQVVVVKNIPDSENSSLRYPFTNGVDYKIIGLSEFHPNITDEYIIGSIGKSREKIKSFFEEKYSIKTEQYLNLIHPSAVIADSVEIGHGIHVGPLSVVAPFAILSNHCTINRNVSIGHHTKLHEFACINPGSTVAGLCSIGRNTTIGAGSIIIDGITIDYNSLIGAGSLVTKNIEKNVVAFGSPAKVIRNITG